MPRTVLVADDSPTIQNKAKGILTGEGLEVVTVSNGVAAIKKLPAVKPLLVLADVSMPGKDGYEVCDFIKNSPDMRHVPVVLIFSDLDPYNDEQGARVRADGRIKKMVAGKPFDPEELISTVTKFIAQAEASARAPQPAATVVTAPPRQPSVVTEPVDAEPAAPTKKGVDIASLSQNVAFAESTLEEFPGAPAEPMAHAGVTSESAPEAAPAVSDTPVAAGPLLTEEPAVAAAEPEPLPAPERTMMFRVPSDIAEPVLSDELAPTPLPAEPLLVADEPESAPVAASTLESFSLTDATTGQVRFAPPASEAEAETVETPAGPALEASAAPSPSPALDTDLIYTIVHKVVSKMSPRALSRAVIDEMASELAQEIVAELSSGPS